MLNTEFFKSSGFFQYKEFKAGELVFDEGDIDENIYIILSGKVSIEKYTTIEKKETKELAILGESDFFGEASFIGSEKKEALVKVLQEVKLIYINGKTGIKNFVEKYPDEGIKLYNYIVDETNNRLLKANKLIIANYEIVKSIIEIDNINDKCIFEIIEKIKLITGYKYILYLEVNQVVKDYLILKYDTREKGKLQDIVIERGKFSTLKELDDIVLKNNNFVQKLSIGKYDLGFMIFGNDLNFTYEDKKLIASISNNLTGLLKQKEIIKEELNKNYMKGGLV